MLNYYRRGHVWQRKLLGGFKPLRKWVYQPESLESRQEILALPLYHHHGSFSIWLLPSHSRDVIFASPRLLLQWVALQRLLPKRGFELRIHRRRAAHLLITQLLGTCREIPCQVCLLRGIQHKNHWKRLGKWWSNGGEYVSFPIFRQNHFGGNGLHCRDSPEQIQSRDQGFEYPSMNQVCITKYREINTQLAGSKKWRERTQRVARKLPALYEIRNHGSWQCWSSAEDPTTVISD